MVCGSLLRLAYTVNETSLGVLLSGVITILNGSRLLLLQESAVGAELMLGVEVGVESKVVGIGEGADVTVFVGLVLGATVELGFELKVGDELGTTLIVGFDEKDGEMDGTSGKPLHTPNVSDFVEYPDANAESANDISTPAIINTYTSFGWYHSRRNKTTPNKNAYCIRQRQHL